MSAEETRRVAKLFYFSYVAGQGDTDAINSIAELIEGQDTAEIVQRMALYPVAGEAEIEEVNR